MKIFIDTANVEQIRELSFILDGVTTNPSLAAKENKNYNTILKEICKIVDGPISAETISEDAEGMVKEGREFSKIHKNIVIKCPMTEEGIKAVKQLTKEGIKTNVTLVFTVNQAILAAKAGATYVSPFVGRLDDIGQRGMDLIKVMVEVFKNYNFQSQIIVASIRNPVHVYRAAKCGAHISTIPYDIIKKMFKHPLTDIGIRNFLDDWKKVPKK
jgi:transaldolase